MDVSLKQKFKNAFRLFGVFFKIGLFSFGGGYAMLMLIEKEVVDKLHYLTHDELADIFAIAESTPGAIAINIATFIGTKQAGVLGGILTTLGVVLPSFLIILGVSMVIDLIRDNVWVAYLFKGIRVGVLVLIARAVITFWRGMKKNILNILITAAAFLIVFLTNISVIYVLLSTIILFTLIVIIKNLRIKKLGIIIDTDAYQKKIVEEAEKEKNADLDILKNINDNAHLDNNDVLYAQNHNLKCDICTNEKSKNNDGNNEEGGK